MFPESLFSASVEQLYNYYNLSNQKYFPKYKSCSCLRMITGLVYPLVSSHAVIIKAEDRVKLLPAAGVRAFIHWNSTLATIDPEGRREAGGLPY